MLAGVGGRTIAEAKQALSYAEVLDWLEYRQRRGSFNVGWQVERSGAVLAALIHNIVSKDKAAPHDYGPHIDKPRPVPLTFENVARLFS